MSKVTVAKDGTMYAIVTDNLAGIEGKRRKVHCFCTSGKSRFDWDIPTSSGITQLAYFFIQAGISDNDKCPKCGYFYYYFKNKKPKEKKKDA